MADLRVDYQLLTSINGTLRGLAGDLEGPGAQDRIADPVYGSGDITAAMSGFSGNWADHRKKLVGTMQDLARMAEVTTQSFRRTDHQLAGHLSSRPAAGQGGA